MATELDSQRALEDTEANADRLAAPDIRWFDAPDRSEDLCPAASSR